MNDIINKIEFVVKFDGEDTFATFREANNEKLDWSQITDAQYEYMLEQVKFVASEMTLDKLFNNQ